MARAFRFGLPFDADALPTPCYVIDEDLLARNLAVLGGVQERTGARILLALKGYSAFPTFAQVGRTLAGVTASSLHEARLGREEMGREVHVYAPAYVDEDFDELLSYADHVVFNSFSQRDRFLPRIEAARAAGRRIEVGLRVNPGYSEVATPLYDPCAPNSRLGIPRASFEPGRLGGVDGLHFHAMCEQGSDTLERVAASFERLYGEFFRGMEWLNLGGGHHVTRADYDVPRLERVVKDLQDRYGVQVYLEPGEAIALNAGYLVARVLDTMRNGMDLAILDASAACHMPDVLEMPYRPGILGAGAPGEKPHVFRLGGPTCLAGDVVGDYAFDAPLAVGDRLVFTDMAHYTMVKNNTFNGVNLPSIALWSAEKGLRVVRRFGYEDYRTRLG